MLRLSFTLLLAAVLPTSPAGAKDVVIHAGVLIDGVSRQPRREISIIIKDDRIVAVEAGYRRPEGAEIIDLSKKTVLPGLIDTHVHVSGAPDLPQPTERGGQRTPGSLAGLLRMTTGARALLEAGFTSVRNVGASNNVDLALKRGIEDGVIPGPRMWVSLEAVGPSGGHSDPANGGEAGSPDHKTNAIADTPDAFRLLIRQHKRRGADLIKIMPSGGVLSIGDNPHHQLMTDVEIKAAIDTAHELGLKVAAHAAGKKAIEASVRLGVDSIEHGSFADAETIKLMRQHGTFLVPTVLIAELTREAVVAGRKMPPTVAEKNFMVWSAKRKMLAAAYAGGVRIAFGSDTGDGQNAREFRYMIDAGMTPMDSIIAATGTAAELIGAPADIGTLQPGRFADIIAVDGDPLANIRELEDVDFVMKGGWVVKDKRP